MKNMLERSGIRLYSPKNKFYRMRFRIRYFLKNFLLNLRKLRFGIIRIWWIKNIRNK